MKVKWIILLAAILALCTTGCTKPAEKAEAPAEPPATVAPADAPADAPEDALKAKAKPVIEHFFTALKSKDFEGMRRDFDDKLLAAVPAEVFEKEYNEESPKVGDMVSWDFTGWMTEGGFDVVLVEAAHAKGDKFQYKFVFPNGPEGTKLGGLWKKPLPGQAAESESAAFQADFGPVAESHMAAVKAKDFEGARKDFSKAMLDALGADKLKQTIEGLNIGELVSWKFDRVLKIGEFVGLYFEASFSSGGSLTYKFVFKPGSDKKIEGLWILPLGSE